MPPDYRRRCIYAVPDAGFRIDSLDRRYLPYIKLHGSYDWQTETGKRLVISGGDKSEQIFGSALLRSYFDFFSSTVKKPETQIVAIGYGFNDEHINRVIVDACKMGAKIALMNPSGAQVTRGKGFDQTVNETGGKSDVFSALRGVLSVLSQRPLTEIFAEPNQAKLLFQGAFNRHFG